MPDFEMVCLANSRKRQGRCIAGVRTDGGGWLRPVSPLAEGALFSAQFQFANRDAPRPLDVIHVGCRAPQPRPHQPENWVTDGTQWRLIARPQTPTVTPLLQNALVLGPMLLGNGADRVWYDGLARTPVLASLALVEPQGLHWQIALTHNFTRQTRAEFTLKGIPYTLSVTDPLWEQRLRHLPEGRHDLAASGIGPEQQVLLTVSLSEPFNGYCYKLVAAVMTIKIAS